MANYRIIFDGELRDEVFLTRKKRRRTARFTCAPAPVTERKRSACPIPVIMTMTRTIMKPQNMRFTEEED